MSEDKIASINIVIADYFKNNPQIEWLPVKGIMPALIAAGVFYKDEKKGLPFRKVLRTLDLEKALDKIPSVHAERKGIDTYWYLVREGAQYISKDNVLLLSKKEQAILNRENSDEYYLVDLCNELLNEKASQQHTFNYLLGDLHKKGKERTELPIDAFYSDLNLAIEFLKKDDEASSENEKITISGVSRSEQRKKYAQRKRDVLQGKEIDLIEINYTEFKSDEEHKLIRNKVADIKVLKRILKDFIK